MITVFVVGPRERQLAFHCVTSAIHDASTWPLLSPVLRRTSHGSTDSDVRRSPNADVAAETSHANDIEHSGAFSPVPEGIAVLGGSPMAVLSARRRPGARSSLVAQMQDGHDDQLAKTPAVTNTATSERTGVVRDVSSGRHRRRRREKVKETKDAIDKVSTKRSKVGASRAHPRRSKKNRARESLPLDMPEAVTVHVPDEVPIDSEHVALIAPHDLGVEALPTQQFSTGTSARPVT